MAQRKLLMVACDGSGANSLKKDYNFKEFKDLKKGTPGDPKDPGDIKLFDTPPADEIQLKSHTNIWRMCEALADTGKDGCAQECQYILGVASGTAETAWQRFCLLSVGIETPDRMVLAYQWLCKHYNDTAGVMNEIILLGYSRGAFTARAVAGMINTFGLLAIEPGELDPTQKPLTYDSPWFLLKCVKVRGTYFRDRYTKIGRIDSNDTLPTALSMGAVDKITELGTLRQNFQISAIGCWESIGALGIPTTTCQQLLLKIPLVPQVAGAIAGLAFGPTDFTKPTTFENIFDQEISAKVKNAFHSLALNESMQLFRPSLWEMPTNSQNATNLEQCWFAGDHIDNGGGSAGEMKGDRQIADITLAWMMTRLEATTSIRFKDGYLPTTVEKSFQMAGANVQPWGLGKTRRVLTRFAGRLSGIGYAIVGSQVRSPGWYHRLNPDGSKSDQWLMNTNEQVHKSVRYRLAHPTGKASDNDGDYNPLALKSWLPLNEKFDPTTKGEWKWNGWSGNTPNMVEPPLTGRELELKRLYDARAGQPVQ